MRASGFSLLEVLVAVAVLSVGALGGIQLVATSIEAMSVARTQNLTATLASSRLEQLRNLTFEYDAAGLRLTDDYTNLATETPSSGGSGLASSVAGSLDADTPGFVDYLDQAGRWVGSGATPPAPAAFVRRWSVTPSGLHADAIVLQVLVSPLAGQRAVAGGRARGETQLVTVRARSRR